MVKDLKSLMEVKDAVIPDATVMQLWDDRLGLQKFGVQYHENEDEPV